MTPEQVEAYIASERGQRMVERMARERYPNLRELFPASFFADQEWDDLPASAVAILTELAADYLRAALIDECETCEANAREQFVHRKVLHDCSGSGERLIPESALEQDGYRRHWPDGTSSLLEKRRDDECIPLYRLPSSPGGPK